MKRCGCGWVEGGGGRTQKAVRPMSERKQLRWGGEGWVEEVCMWGGDQHEERKQLCINVIVMCLFVR